MKLHRLYRFVFLVLVLSLLFCSNAGAQDISQTETQEAPAAPKKEKKGWHKTASGKYYYILKNGKRATGLQKIKRKTYYFNKNGIRQTGWKRIRRKYYYFNDKGVMQTGWLKIKKNYYYLGSDGARRTGWNTVNGVRYYFDPATGARARGVTQVGDHTYYFTKNGKLVKNQYTGTGEYTDVDGKVLQKSTLKKFLQVALQPVGSTMYVWGGGWGTTGAGVDAVTMGVSPQWEKYFNQQGSGYNYRNTRYQSRNGLDCSGYVGWVVYNAFNTTSGNAGYVMLAQNMTRAYANKGWGSYTSAGSVKNYRAGDIMSTSEGHVYIVIGRCNDGSVVFVHSSPQGVQINGTTTRSGSSNSQAIKLATKYMKKYFPKWYSKFPSCSRGTSYLTNYSQMRWYLKGNCMMSDPDKYAKRTPAYILRDLLGPA